ncbi:glycoside hydrolase family 72 protein [Polychaeton citri CBS 116435]|uniref:1,3-beta-glucanosyltransferase n=1 Tax=Polychaeton citri CBS 116435 TaxID=1314669 RepID=A0A9P4QAY8_9PEZI|nr:glycoside hydrolase family 72 protein [Polychaeton citri CBS 116435]
MTKANSASLHICGQYLLKENSRFLIRGIVYQIHGTVDPISDECLPQLEQDILLFNELGLNTLFVYSIDSTKTHADAMKVLEAAGIYVFTVVSTPHCNISRLSPHESYTSSTMTSFFKVVDIMASFSNTLGVMAGSELVNSNDTMLATPVIRAVIRDLKRYMKLKNERTGQRVLPIGYNAATSNARDQIIL